MDEKTILLGLLTKTLNLSEQETTDLLYQKDKDDPEKLTLKPESQDVVLAKYEAKIKKLKDESTPSKEILDNQYKRGVKETAESWEKSIKAKFGVESELNGDELISLALAETVNKHKKAKDITDEEFKMDKRFITAETSWKTQMNESISKVQSEFETFKSQAEKNKVFDVAKMDIKKIFDAMKPVQSTDSEINNNRYNDYINKFSHYDIQLAEDGNHILSKDGKRLEDSFGNLRNFKEVVENTTKLYYDLEKQSGKNGAGSKTGEGGAATTIIIPKTEQERNKMLANEIDPVKRVEIADAYDESQKQ